MAPSTPISEFDLSAALEDAEGHQLAQDIIDRKKLRNLRDRFMQELIFGDVLTDGHGNVIPRELPGYWNAVKDVWDEHTDAKLSHTINLNSPPVTVLRGPAIHITWEDEHLMTHATGWRNFLVGGRGFGKRARAIEALRKWNSRPEAFIPHKAPDIGEVRWACKRPTAPVYAVGTNGWLWEQAEARVSPEMREYNRKLESRYRAKVSGLLDLLGVTPNGSND